jgi:hypothetical protein
VINAWGSASIRTTASVAPPGVAAGYVPPHI